MKAKVFLAILLTAQWLVAADYEILEKNDDIVIDSNSFAREHHKIVVKILNKKGADYREYIAVNGYIQVKNVTGSVRHADGKIVPIKSDSILEVPISESLGMLTDYKAVVIVPPNLEPGSIMTLEYDRHITSLLYIDPWDFGAFAPIRKSRCSITYPSHVPIKFRGVDEAVKLQKSESGGKTTVVLEATNQPEISVQGNERFAGTMKKQVVFAPEECMTEKWRLSTRSWAEIAEWFSELSKFAYQSDPASDEVVREIVAQYTDPAEIAEAIYQYIQKYFVYTAIEIGIGGYKPRFASHTFQKKFGDCKDLTILFLSMLKKAGIEGYPALVDTRSTRFFYSDFPSPNQFNHCIAYLPKIRNGVWVDSTVKNFTLGEVPSVIQGKQALVSGGPNMLLKVPEDFENSNVLRLNLSGHFGEREISWKGTVETAGQASGYVRSLKNALMKNRVRHYVYSNLLFPGLPLKNLDADYEDDRSLSLSFDVPVHQNAGYRVFIVNALNYPPMENLTAETQANEYFSLGMPVRFVVESQIGINGQKMVSSPIRKQGKGEFVSYSLDLSEDGGKLRYLADTYFANGLLDQKEMQRYQKELRELSALIQRTVVLQ